MSGPKVVRIVTRQEMIAACEANLARLDAAARSYAAFCQKRGLATDDELAAVEKRRIALHALLSADQFLDLQRRVPQEIAYLEAARQARVKKAAEIAAAREASLQRATALARQVLASTKGQNGDRELVERLERVASGRTLDLDEANSVLAQAYAISSQGDDEPTDAQIALASSFSAGTKVATLDEWRTTHLVEANGEDAEVLTLLSEFELEADLEAAEAFRNRWALLTQETDVKLRGLRRDSLQRELSVALSELRERAQHVQTMIAFASEWDILNPRKEPPWSALAVAAQSLAGLRDVVKAARAEVEAERQRKAVAARREAILKELAALGYEVREGLQTALAKDGKVVVRKAAHPDYGVEVIAPDKGDKLAFRAVIFGQGSAPRNKARDADIEVLWCSDFEKLRADLSAVGGHVAIEKAVAAGVEPLKLIEVEATTPAEEHSVSIEQARTRLR
jgi:hypothetical protein